MFAKCYKMLKIYRNGQKQIFFFYLHKKRICLIVSHLQACFFQIINILDKWEIICTCAHKCISKYCIIKRSKDISIMINVRYRISKIKQISMWNVHFILEYNSTDIFLLSTCMYVYTRCIFIKCIVFCTLWIPLLLSKHYQTEVQVYWPLHSLEVNFFSPRNAYCKKYMKDSCFGE